MSVYRDRLKGFTIKVKMFYMKFFVWNVHEPRLTKDDENLAA
jgi:hypothetical protein